ncbi:hypothetical protein FB107DRAFT_292943 [Schizophyllum commune]
MDCFDEAASRHVQEHMLLQQGHPDEGDEERQGPPISSQLLQRGYVAHVDRIPAEIYTLIFEFSVSMDALSAYNFFFDDTTKAPWLLGQVCSRWRTIVHDAPTLWTIVRLSTCLLQEGPQPEESIVEMLVYYLERSKSLPISLFLLSEEYFPEPILAPLLDCSDRWRDVFLFLHPDHLPRFVPIRDRLHQLRTMSLIPTVPSNTADYMRDMFKAAPSLESLALNGHSLELGLSFPWAQIRIFEANYVDPADILRIMPSMPRMLRLQLGREPPERTLEDTTNWIVRHNGIRSLSLNSIDDHIEGHPADLIDHLDLPAMSSLSIQCDRAENMEAISDLLQRSACTIRELKLDIRFDHADRLLHLLRDQPRLAQVTKLTLHDGEPIGGLSFTTALCVASDDPASAIMPLVDEMDILLSTDAPGPFVQRWLSVFESRVSPAQPTDPELPRLQSLQRITIGCRSGSGVLDDPGCMNRFRALAQADIELELNCGEGVI